MPAGSRGLLRATWSRPYRRGWRRGGRQRRRLAPAGSGAARRRRLNLGELGLTRADQSSGDDLTERTCDPLAIDVQHLARDQLGSETKRLRGRKADNCAVLEQHSVEVALRPMQLRLDTALRRQRLTG